jgi:hypothetical protein
MPNARTLCALSNMDTRLRCMRWVLLGLRQRGLPTKCQATPRCYVAKFDVATASRAPAKVYCKERANCSADAIGLGTRGPRCYLPLEPCSSARNLRANYPPTPPHTHIYRGTVNLFQSVKTLTGYSIDAL